MEATIIKYRIEVKAVPQWIKDMAKRKEERKKQMIERCKELELLDSMK